MSARRSAIGIAAWTAAAILLLATAAPAEDAAAALERIKGLAGEWIEEGSPNAVDVSYRVTGGGSAIVETLFPGTPHEMVTVYHLDGPDLVLTHYCAAKNQPQMKAGGFDGKQIAFRFTGGSNIDPAKTGHMHEMTMTFLDADHVKTEWVYFEGGAKGQVKVFQLTRKKA